MSTMGGIVGNWGWFVEGWFWWWSWWWLVVVLVVVVGDVGVVDLELEVVVRST